MNKKTLIVAPLAVLTMGLTSCGGRGSLPRHSFKESTRDAIDAIANTLKGKQVVDDKITMQEKKVSFEAYNESQYSVNYGKSTKTITLLTKYTGGLDQDTKTAKISMNGEAKDSDDYGEYMKVDEETYLKFLDNKRYQLTNDKILGCKTGSSSPLTEKDDFNTLALESFEDELNITYDNYQVKSFECDVYGRGLFDEFFKDSGKGALIDLFASKNVTIAYGSNDDKSLMFSIKGKLDYADYVDFIEEKESDCTYSGEVELDFFACIENAFVTQYESTVKYNNCKEIYKEGSGDLDATINGETYGRCNIQYGSGSTINVNVEDYDIEK